MLEQFIWPPTSVSGEEEEVGTEDGTRNFPRFSWSESTLMSFPNFLTNTNGESTKLKSCQGNYNWCFKFACGQVPLPKWEHLLDRDIHMDKCKRFKIETDGRISKLDARQLQTSHICQQLDQAKMEVISFITLSWEKCLKLPPDTHVPPPLPPSLLSLSPLSPFPLPPFLMKLALFCCA